VHIIKLPSRLINMATKSKSELLMVPFYGTPLNSARGCFQMAVTIVVVTKNMCMSRRWKVDQLAYEIRKQPSPRSTHLMPLNLGFHSNVQSVQNSSAP
jgi:hypothetical protein